MVSVRIAEILHIFLKINEILKMEVERESECEWQKMPFYIWKVLGVHHVTGATVDGKDGLNDSSCELLRHHVLLIHLQEKHENISFTGRCCYLVAGDEITPKLRFLERCCCLVTGDGITPKYHFSSSAGIWWWAIELTRHWFLERCWALVAGDINSHTIN